MTSQGCIVVYQNMAHPHTPSPSLIFFECIDVKFDNTHPLAQLASAPPCSILLLVRILINTFARSWRALTSHPLSLHAPSLRLALRNQINAINEPDQCQIECGIVVWVLWCDSWRFIVRCVCVCLCCFVINCSRVRTACIIIFTRMCAGIDRCCWFDWLIVLSRVCTQAKSLVRRS